MATETGTERPATAGRLPRDLVAGGVILAGCAGIFVVSLQIAEAPPALAQNVQPATFPRMVLGVIASLAALMIVLGLGHAEPARRAPKLITIATGAAMIAFVLAFATLGPLTAMVLFCLGMPVLWGAKLSPALVVYALSFPLVVWLLFGVVLSVQFPPGALEGLLRNAL